MKLLLYFVLFIGLNVTYAQRSFYVSNAGNDSNNGLSQTTPFQTINKINSLTLQPGDNIFFRRGDTFRGTLVIKYSGTANSLIRVDAYGTGAKPVLAGSVPVVTWNNTGTNLWQATCPSCGTVVTGLYQGGNALPLGRYPNLSDTNKGYLTIQSHQGKTQITSQQLLTTNWVGGEAVYRPNYWILNRATITQQSGNILTLNNASSDYDFADGGGYFIQNHPATLDQNGEWYYNPANKTFSLYSLQNPNTQQITATVNAYGIQSTYGLSYITIQNLRVTQDLNAGVYLTGISSSTITNLEIINSGEDAMNVYGAGSNVLIENNLIDQSNNNAVDAQYYTNLIFRKNKVRRIGLIPGRGRSGDGQYRGLSFITTTNTLVENNIVDSIGYSGISFSANTTGLTIQKNIVSNFLLIKNEGGGIYTYNAGQEPMSNIKVSNNIIYNGIGSSEGAVVNPAYSAVNGIYLDACTKNVEVSNNTVFDCRGIGIFLVGLTDDNISQNTCYNNGEAQLIVTFGGPCAPRNNTITGNALVAKATTQATARYESASTDIGQYGLIDNNYYARPLDDATKIGASFLDVNVNTITNLYGLKDWQRLYGKDLNTKESPIKYSGYTLNSTTEASRIGNGTFNSDVSEWYNQSDYSNGKHEWDNSNKLDGGSMRIYFQPSSGHKASYIYVLHNANVITAGRSYVLRFDAIASANGKTILSYLRERNGPQELALRSSAVVGTTRKHYEMAFTATQDNADAILMLKVLEDGESIWLDNISFQEANIRRDNPDDLIKLFYNPHDRDTTIMLTGNYRDIKDQFYSQQIVLSPFSSVILLRNAGPDLTPTINLPLASFSSSGDNAVRNFIVNVFETGNQPTSTGNIMLTMTAPVGYRLSYANSIASINVSGGTSNPVAVDNSKWSSINPTANQLTLMINNGQFIAAGGTAVLGFTITRTTATSGSTSNITVNVTNDTNYMYDTNPLNNIYARIINSL